MRPDAGPSTARVLFQPATGFASDGDDMADDDDSGDDLDLTPLAADRLRAAQLSRDVAGLFNSDSVLPDECFGSLPVRDIFDMIENKVINLSPDYQRDVVWTADHVTGLIQSLFRNMHVPELLFNIYEPRDRDDPWYRRIPAAIQIQPEGRTSLPDGWALKAEDDDEREDGDVMQVWNCADGKQRMSAIRKFMTGQVAIKGSDGKLVVYSSLAPDARALFDSKRLRYGFYRNLSNAQEREVFQRVQRGKVLSKGEVLNSIDSAYSNWVRGLISTYLGDSHDSLCPRMLSAGRGTALVGAYQASRNIILGVDNMSTDSDAQRFKVLGQDAPPRQAEQDEVSTAMDRFLALTKVAPLEGEDRWPDTPLYEPLRQHGVPVPHRVWRLRPDMVPARRNGKVKLKLGSDSIAFAPVELHMLPAIVHRYRHLDDGDLLELVELVRVHVHDKLTGEVKANKKTYELVKDWIKEFKPADLTHKYNDDGSLRDGSRRSSNVAGFTGLAAATTGSGRARQPRQDEHAAAAAAAAAAPPRLPEPAQQPPPAAQQQQLQAGAPSSKKRTNAAEDGSASSGASTPAAAKRVRTASGLGASAGLFEATSDFGGAVDSPFQVPARRDSNGAGPSSSCSFLPVETSANGRHGNAAAAPAVSGSSSSNARPTGPAPPRPPPPPPRSATTAFAAPFASALSPTTAPAPAGPSGLSEKQLKYLGRVNPAAAAPPPPPVRTRQPPPPPPPAPAPGPAPAPVPTTQPPHHRSTVPHWKRRPPSIQYDERGRPILAAASASSSTSTLVHNGGSSAFGSTATPSYGGPALAGAGYEAENDVSLSVVEDDETLDPHGAPDYGGLDGGASASASASAIEQDEVHAAIFGAQRRAAGPPAAAPGSFAAADARAATSTGRRTASGGGGGATNALLVKGDPDEEDARAAAALLGARDERDDEVMGLVRARQRGESRAPPAEPSATSRWEREGSSAGARRRSPEPSGWDTDWRREERREEPRAGWRAALEGGHERRPSGGYEAAERDSGWRRRDDFRDDERAQTSRGRFPPPEPRRHQPSRGYPPSVSPPPPPPSSSSTRLPTNLPPPRHRQGSAFPPHSDFRSDFAHDSSRSDSTRAPAPPHDAASQGAAPRRDWDQGWQRMAQPSTDPRRRPGG